MEPELEVQGSVWKQKSAGYQKWIVLYRRTAASDVTPSYELIKRAQEAMQVLGIYSGKIDG